jgi:hypothetical protein
LTLLLSVTLEPDSVTTLQDRWSRVRAQDSAVVQIFETGSGAYPAFYSVGARVLYWD